MDKFFITVGVIALALPLIFGIAILLMMWRSWWLYPAWGWFVVPLGVPPVSFWHFTAVLFLIAIATHQGDHKKDKRDTDWGSVATSFVWAPLSWALLRWMH